MANSALAKLAKRSLDRVEKDIRKTVQDYEGQVFIWHVQGFITLLEAFTSDETIINTLVNSYRTKLKAANAKIMKVKRFRARLNKTKADIIKYKIEGYEPKNYELYAVLNYPTVVRIKRDIGTKYAELTGRNSKEITGRVDSGDKQKEATGQQVGHGEFGHAVSTTKVFMAEAALSTKAAQKIGARPENVKMYTKLQSRIASYKEDMKITSEVVHVQEVTSRGGIRKIYTPILSSEDASQNLVEGINEKSTLAKLKRELEKDYQDIVNQQGSDTLLEAIESVQLYNIIPKDKNVKYKGTSKPRKTVKSRGKGKATSKKQQVKKVPIIVGAGAPDLNKANPTRSPRSGGSLISIIGLINETLPDVVAKNMKSPRLVNRTGRFADSVRAVDAIKTPRGFPSIGYTYQKSPYQTFEIGYRQGSTERDPRRLIDASIREIAAKFAIGRFYTRRV